ncbi:ATP-dependent DNA helicase [Pelistega ratti]|uniref:ATP-dependent DNA helicase n=1 Tax=Pelistega ratti TaxID=2652177 RepID=UPI001FA9721F|nr:ATP-dependent DNA helicase [Pelistega ratti]
MAIYSRFGTISILRNFDDMSGMVDLDVSDFFKHKLARIKPDYVFRQSQVALSQAIEKTIAQQSVLIAEAGTGTGKTWAYLVPAFMSFRKTLISTGTKALQDQLFRKDVPMLKKALGLPIQVALLKGRSNYLCHFHYNRLVNDDYTQLNSKEEVEQLKEIKLFFQKTATGDKSDCAKVPDKAPIWLKVTSTNESCLNQDCPYINECFLAQARKKAREADVVIVNHALFFADMALRKEAQIDLLPIADTVIFDEAHQLPEIATQFLGSQIALSSIEEVVKDIELYTAMYAKRVAEWSKLCGRVTHDLMDLRLTARPIDSMPGKKAILERIPDNERLIAVLEKVVQGIDDLHKSLEAVNEQHLDLKEVYNRLDAYYGRLLQWIYPEKFDQDNQDSYVRWVEYGKHQLRLYRAPLSVKNVANFKREDQAWILTSATLSVNHQFTHFQAQLGLFDAECQTWESPFQYAEKAVMYVPDHLPDVKVPHYEQDFVRLLIPFIQRTPGGVLILSTTLRSVDSLGTLLQEALLREGIHKRIFRQGETAHRVLIDQFQQEKNGILIGSASFWEGVDFPGDLVTLVAIDKLPFAPPDDPVLEARIEECRKKGGNPFMDIQLPMAAIALKQGAGRLIRTEQDSGVLIIGDGRLVNQHYSKLLWGSLPNFYRTRHFDTALNFWQENR